MSPPPPATGVLDHWNALDPAAAAAAILPCCGSHAWAAAMAAARPIPNPEHLLARAADLWHALPAADHDQAFRSHPRIGEQHAPAATPQSQTWSAAEQATAATDLSSRQALADLNRTYEARFGRVFLICATGRTAPEILAEAARRLQNDPATERSEALEQQRQITALRLARWLGQPALADTAHHETASRKAAP